MPVVDQPRQMLDAAALRSVITAFRDAVALHQDGINRLNVYPVPDGDTGTNMRRTLDAVVEELASAPNDLDAVCGAIAHGSLMGARGNSGVILSQILRGFTSVIRSAAEVTGAEVARGLSAASAAADDAVLTPVEGTILTVARDTAHAAEAAAAAGAALDAVLLAARDEARASLARTPDLLPVLHDAGVVDAGGAGFLLLLDAALLVVTAEPVPQPSAPADSGSDVRGPEPAEPDSGDMRFEVMYLLELADRRLAELKARWGMLGDSVVVVGGDGTWNCHVHTNDIGGAIEAALDLGGRPSRIRVTDLFEEVAEEHMRREAAITAPTQPPAIAAPTATTVGIEPVTCAVVAVASGPGLGTLFGDLGVQHVVRGGQTLNPSTSELLSAVESVPSEQVVVLPNNKNIVPVAGQLDALTGKNVVVVPTRSMPEGLAALVVYDPEASAELNATAMSSAAAAVATGEVTTAVRDATSATGPVSTGDWIGLVSGDGIVAAGPSVVDVATSLLDHLVTSDRELLTVLVGDQAVDADTDAIVAWVAAARPRVEVEVHRGDQPLYPYLFCAE